MTAAAGLAIAAAATVAVARIVLIIVFLPGAGPERIGNRVTGEPPLRVIRVIDVAVHHLKLNSFATATFFGALTNRQVGEAVTCLQPILAQPCLRLSVRAKLSPQPPHSRCKALANNGAELTIWRRLMVLITDVRSHTVIVSFLPVGYVM